LVIESLPLAKNQTRKQTKTKFAASAAVRIETGNFKKETAFEARPQVGVPKAFSLRHTSA